MTGRSGTPDSAGAATDATGVQGLDNVLAGGFTARRMYLVEGSPGSGKTTLAMQFLMEGARRGEPVLHVSLSETIEELQDVAASHGWSLEGITLRELIPAEDSLEANEQYTMFHPAEVELSATTRSILEDVDRIKARRVVVDSLSELRLLAGSPLRYRRQILALKQSLVTRNCTVILLDDLTTVDHSLEVHSIAHGVVSLEQLSPEYGAERRRLRIVKYRGRRFRGGYHDFVIRRGGLDVYPRLVATEHRREFERTKLLTGVPALDHLLGGGIEPGTSSLIVGAAGTGKSTLAVQCAVTSAQRGARAAIFVFDEGVATLESRMAELGIDLATQKAAGRVTIQQVDPAELSPGEFAHTIRKSVEDGQAELVIIDSLNGYLNAMPEERYLVIQLHELLSYLGQLGVATLLIAAHQGLIGSQMTAPVDTTYLADSVILMRYFESQGEVRQAISVVKNRGGSHERTIREFRLRSGGGIEIGAPLREFRGVLTGVPTIEPSGTAAHKPDGV
jgi:circadian clock protein KaiC